MRGTVTFWHDRRGSAKPWGWGKITPFGVASRSKCDVYFNTHSAHYSPIIVGDDVEYETFKNPLSAKLKWLAARKVELIQR